MISLPFWGFITAALASSVLKSRSSFSLKTVPVSSETPFVFKTIVPFTLMTLKFSWPKELNDKIRKISRHRNIDFIAQRI
jgi:choline-glycine betaine transporter